MDTEIHRQYGDSGWTPWRRAKTAWKDVLREFYGDFEQDLEKAEKDLDGARIKVPDEVSPRRSARSAGGIWW